MFLLSDIAMFSQFCNFYYKFIYFKLYIDDKTIIFDAGIEILQSRFGLDIKHADINKTEFECDATNETCLKSAGYNAYQWFHQLSYNAVKIISISFVAIIIKMITGVVAVFNRYNAAQINRYY